MNLAQQDCIPSQVGVPALTPEAIEPLARQVPDWDVISNHHLRRRFRFADFRLALEFVNAIGAEAERVQHHPDIELSWGRVAVQIHSHEIDGLAQADFVLAARIDLIATSSPNS